MSHAKDAAQALASEVWQLTYRKEVIHIQVSVTQDEDWWVTRLLARTKDHKSHGISYSWTDDDTVSVERVLRSWIVFLEKVGVLQ